MPNGYGLIPTSEAIARFLLPQTLTFVGITTGLLAVISVLVRIRATYRTDLAATLYLQRLDHPTLTVIARWATFMGNSLTLILIAIGLLVVSVVMKEPSSGILIVASLVALPVNAALKNMFDRARPGEDEVHIHPGPRWGFSYPSGHSMGSAAFYGVVATMIWLSVLPPPTKAVIAGTLVAIPLLTGLSRIYLGAHWLSDVVGGWTAGAAIALAATALYGPIAL